MKRLLILTGLSLGTLAFLAVLAPPAPAQSTGASFVPLVPCRVVDTRWLIVGSPNGSPGLNAGAVRTFQIKDFCGVPTTAKAVALSLTSVGPTAAGHIILWPAGEATPGTSNLNFVAGQPPIASFAIVKLATSTMDLSAAYGTAGQEARVHLLLDVHGYYE